MKTELKRYEENLINKLFNKVKMLFTKVKPQAIGDGNNTHLEQVGSLNLKRDFIELVNKFENREIQENELKIEEVEYLTKYYINKNKELDNQIEIQGEILKNMELRLNSYYEKFIKLKEEKSF